MTTRRETLSAALACALGSLGRGATAYAAPGAPAAAASTHELRDLVLGPREAPFGGRVPVLVPRSVARGARLPFVVALHGLGESADPALGARAWPSLYGLVDAADRLAAPPWIARGTRRDLAPEEIARLNASLAARPFAGLVVACPFTPNPAKARDRGDHLARYAEWIRTIVIERARQQFPVLDRAATTHLAGCSMGGAVAIELAERMRGALGSVALVQSAHGAHRNDAIAANARTAGPGGGALPLLVLTSQGDPFRERNVALGASLAKAGVPHEAVVLAGPHDQPWLREAGTPTMLRWLDERPRT